MYILFETDSIKLHKAAGGRILSNPKHVFCKEINGALKQLHQAENISCVRGVGGLRLWRQN